MCTLASTGKNVAVKKIRQDKTYKSRELQIHKEMHHQNIVRLRHAYFVDMKKEGGKTVEGKKENEEAQLNIVMDYIPTNVYRI
jgi:glycogen synthase kinase 3 beta